MEPIRKSKESYIESLKNRSKTSHAYTSHQMIGLEIATILRDWEHRALYMKLAKEHGGQKLLSLAKSIAERKDIRNKGAYFMKILHK